MQSNLEGPSLGMPEDKFRSPSQLKKSSKMSFDAVEGDTEESGDVSTEDRSNQLVVYNPDTSAKGEDALAVNDPVKNNSPPLRNFLPTSLSNRGLPSIGAFTVQCATCFKWRLIPTKEKYEQIRESILQEPFVCERAREWRPDISCEDPEDISQDGSRLWAIDKPNIARPPPGWERLIRIRGEGGTKFADVYYASPTGKKLRSMLEVERHLMQHPEYIRQGVNLSQFSFQIPRPLHENYVRKRAHHVLNPCDGASLGLSRPLEPEEVNPLSWAAPPSHSELHIGGFVPCTPSEEAIDSAEFQAPPAKRRVRRPPSGENYGSSMCDQPHIQPADAEATNDTLL